MQASEFLTNEHSVGIMDGRDEGIFSWFTVNYLMGEWLLTDIYTELTTKHSITTIEIY